MTGLIMPPSLIPYFTGAKTDYSTLQPQIGIINGIFLALVLITTGARFWVRFRLLSSAGLDDIFMVAAIVFSILLSVSCFIGEGFGLGKHVWNLSPDLTNIPSLTAKVTKSLYGAYLAYATSITFTKLSIAATYYRIFGPGLLRNSVLTVAVLVLGFWISSIFAIIFTCIPVSAAWDYTVTGHCYPIVDFFYASAAFNIATDIFLCILPIRTLWALVMPKLQRVILCILFCGGTFACIASIFRLTHLKNLGGVDVTYTTGSSLAWSVIEVDMGIICASISALRPLAKYLPSGLFPSIFSTASRSNARSTYEKNNTSDRTTSTFSKTSNTSTRVLKAYDNPFEEHEMRPRANSMNSYKGEIYVQHTYEVDSDALPKMPSSSASPLRISSYKKCSLGNPAHDGGTHEPLTSITSTNRGGVIVSDSGLQDYTLTKQTPSEASARSPRGQFDNSTATEGKSTRKSVVGLFTKDLFDGSQKTTSSEEDLVSADNRRSWKEPTRQEEHSRANWVNSEDDARRSFDETEEEDNGSNIQA